MDAPDELRQAAAVAILGADYDWTAEEAVWDAKEQNEAWALDMADAVLSVPGIADALAAARACEQDVARLAEERDEAQEWADRLAACAGGPEVIGEHSNVNNPWANALDLLRGDGR